MTRLPPIAIIQALPLVLIFVVSGIPAARGCTVCAEIPGTLGAVHPESIRLALAIRREIETGRLAHGLPPGAVAEMGGAELVWHLRRLTELHGTELEGTEFVLIETGARIRIDADSPLGPVIGPATQQLPPPRIRWVTGRDVLHALLERRLDVPAAMDRGILLVEALSVRASGAETPSREIASHQKQATSSGNSNWILLGTLILLLGFPLGLTLVTHLRRRKWIGMNTSLESNGANKRMESNG